MSMEQARFRATAPTDLKMRIISYATMPFLDNKSETYSLGPSACFEDAPHMLVRCDEMRADL